MEDVQEETTELLTSSNRTTKKRGTESVMSEDAETDLPTLITDSDSDGSVWSLVGGHASETTDTSDDDYMFNDSFSEDSSIADDEEYNIFEMLSHYFEMFSSSAPSFFGISLQMFYERLMESLEFEEEKDTPTPQNVLDALPCMKVTIAQIASNLSCCVCFGDYVNNEDILKLPCSHYYHKACILDWLKIKSTCPTCRLDLSKHHETNMNNDTNLSRDSHFQDGRDSETVDRSQNLPAAVTAAADPLQFQTVDNVDSYCSSPSIDVVKPGSYQMNISKNEIEKNENKSSAGRTTDQSLQNRNLVERSSSRSFMHVSRTGSYETEIW